MILRHQIKRLCSAVAILLLVICLMTSTSFADELDSSDSKLIKVFFPLQSGFAQIDQNGNYSGYNYEYLMRIAQLTGWKYLFYPYEPTNENLSKGLEMVKDGDLDLAGTMNYNAALAESYEYSMPYGDTSYALVAREDNETLNARTLAGYNGLKVAIISTAEVQNSLFDKFCRENKIEYEPVYAKNNTECRVMVDDGRADAMINKDISQNINLQVVARFTSTPFYIVSQKGNTDLINQLNSALCAIETADPSYRLRLHEKYFPFDSGKYLSLTMDEKEYIDNYPVVRVAVFGGRAPIQDYNEETGEFSGIVIDILEQISKRSGLKFEFIDASDPMSLRQELYGGGYDIVAGISYYYENNTADGDYNLLRTPPIFTSPIIRISNLQGTARKQGVIVARSIKTFINRTDITYFDEIDKIFDLVESGEYGEAYVNGYMAQYLANRENYPNVSLSFTSYGNYGLCLGVAESSDLRLVNILTQTIASLNENEIEAIVYSNTSYQIENSLWDIIRRNPLQAVVPALIVLIIVLGLLLLLFLKSRKLNKLIAMEKNEYKAISQIDRLSKAYNNTEFKRLAIDYLADESAELHGTFIVCDIDDFKHINDTYGHQKGDEVISRLGAIMKEIFDEYGIVGRLGGDEFAVLLKNMSDFEVVEHLCHLLKEMSATIIEDKAITLSVGAVLFNKRVEFGELFNRADRALYDIKDSSKNSFKIQPMYDATTDTQSQE